MIKLRIILIPFFLFGSLTRISAQQDSARIMADSSRLSRQQQSKGEYHLKPEFVAALPATLNETSGLVYFNSQLWTINDGGNEAALYRVDTAGGKVMRKVTVINAANTDWESITQDDSCIYIGDFGNNYGSRKNLQILKIAKHDLLNPVNDAVKAGVISFTYADQVDFSPRLNQTNFDCEAFFFHDDTLHLFSKNWSDQQTRHYVLPADTGTYTACLTETFNANGLITDAAISREGEIVLLGYKNGGGKSWKCFLWVFSNNGSNRLGAGKPVRIGLGSALKLGQSEGLAFGNGHRLWISSESISPGGIQLPSKLFRADVSSFSR